MGWRRVGFLIYILLSVTLSVVLAIWSLRFFKIESDAAVVVLFIVLASVYGGVAIGLAYDRWKVALIEEKMQILISKAEQFIDRGNLIRAEKTVRRLKSFAHQLDRSCANEITQLETKLASVKSSTSLDQRKV